MNFLKITRGVFREMKRFFMPLIISICLIATSFAYGQTNQQTKVSANSILIVDNEGDGDYLTINGALDNAVEGDTIQIYSGNACARIGAWHHRNGDSVSRKIVWCFLLCNV